MGFASNLREILDYRNMQVKELSAKTGISKNTIDNYLSGQKSLPNIENGVKIAQALGVTVEYLVTGVMPSGYKSAAQFPGSTAPEQNGLPQTSGIRTLLEAFSSLDAIDRASVQALVVNMQKRYQR